MKKVVRLGNILAIITVFYFIYISITHTSILINLEPNWFNIRTIFIAVFTYIYAIIFGALVWFVLLRGVREKVTLLSSVSIVMRSQAAKYIPGNVAHHIGRVILAKNRGLGVSNTLFTMMMETVWVVIIGAVLALAALLVASDEVVKNIPNIPQWWILIGIICITILTPIAGQKLFNQFFRWWGDRNGVSYQSIIMPPIQTFWMVSLLYMLNFLIFGVVLQLLAINIFGTQYISILLLSGVFAIAWVIGFITPGAPAGIGVRELVLVSALTPLYGNDIAVGVAAVLRVVSVLGDGLGLLIGLGLSRIEKAEICI